VSELLAKATNQGALDAVIRKEDAEKLLAAEGYGALDKEYRYAASLHTSDYRGYDIDPGGGLMDRAKASQPIALHDVLQSNLWSQIGAGNLTEFHSTIFQPHGGMDMLPKALAKDLGQAIQYNARVTQIAQNDKAVTVSYTRNGAPQQVQADWCVCTIPASILAQMDIRSATRCAPAFEALRQLHEDRPGIQAPLLGRGRAHLRRHQLHRPADPADLLPSTGYMSAGPAVLLGAYAFENSNSYRFSSLTPRNASAWPWNTAARSIPSTTGIPQRRLRGLAPHAGSTAAWRLERHLREQHYDNMAQIDNRLVLAGEHISFIPAWQEGAVLSSLDAVQRLHAKAPPCEPPPRQGIEHHEHTHSSRGLCAAALLLAGLCSLPALAAPATGTATEVMAIPAADTQALMQNFSAVRQINSQRGGERSTRPSARAATWSRAKAPRAQASTRRWPPTLLAAAAYPVGVVMNGLHGMPSFASKLSDEQMADVVNYVRTHFGNQFTDAVKADDVKLFRK
jgi:monoamine oxidase